MRNTSGGLLFGEPHGGNDASRPRRPLRVDLMVPFGKLALQVVVIDEASLLEERPLPQPARFSTEPFCSDCVANTARHRGQDRASPRRTSGSIW